MCNDNHQCRKREEVVQYSKRSNNNNKTKVRYENNSGGGKKVSKGGMRRLPSTFYPGPMDVICARGAAVYCHPGNRRFRAIIEMNLEQYSQASSKMEKSRIVSSVVASVRRASPHGGFVKEESGSWYEVGDHIAREKIGQSFRDSLHTMYRSSSKAKNSRSKAQKKTNVKHEETNAVNDNTTYTKQTNTMIAEQQQQEILPPPDATLSSATNQLEANSNYVQELFREFKHEATTQDSSGYIDELFQAFQYEDGNPTAIKSFSFNDNDDDVRTWQSKAEDSSSLSAAFSSSPFSGFEQLQADLGQFVDEEISFRGRMVSEEDLEVELYSQNNKNNHLR